MNPTSTLSKRLLQAAIEHHATDLHFYPFPKQTDIYFRIHGKRKLFKQIKTEQYQLLLTFYKFTSGMDIGESRKPQNGTLAHYEKSNLYSLRLSTLPVNQRESLAVRILPQTENVALENLFLFPAQFKKLKKWISKRAGLILLTGPTGSGKTTTMYALLQAILQEESYQTITLEDPIEKEIDDILQVQVNEKAGITYQTGLRAALRHDPDILMIGEIRDKYTAQFAFEAALTGHLVLSTLHAKDTLGTIHRLQEMGIEQIFLEQTLIAIASIQLIPLTINKKEQRAAVLELLDETQLKDALKGVDIRKSIPFQSFYHLRKKAFAYGFISEETFHHS
ncbi:competence type IV pilus ATPase ComGA [Oceanobacillus chungangensis]|uniref:Competence protein n=1 Tax=Oceanobacillus chungangensis TaxID=1229152 RepID=A0A3D8Q0G4_9BACI|nr:competence type IV pilus ATPase ComGA [Oceanobacillus chungangensis]RDW21936.1 competence protein [Oceanobacillus chungangensis]